MMVNTYRRTNQISTRPATAETMPTIRRTLSGVANALFIARRIQAGLAANIRPSSTKRMPTPTMKSVNAMDLIGYQPPLSSAFCFYAGEPAPMCNSTSEVRIFDALRNDDVEICSDVYTTKQAGTIAVQAFNNNLMETAQ